MDGGKGTRTPILCVVAFVVVAGLAGVRVPPAAAAASAPVWSQIRFDAANTGFNLSETSLSTANVASLERDWSARVTRHASAVVAGGVVYAGCEPNSFCALDATDGSVRWKRVVAETVAPQSAVLVGDVLYLGGSRPPTLQALNATTGDTLWTTLVSNGAGDFDTPIAVAEGLIVQGSGQFLFAWDAATGIQRWVVKLHSRGAPAIVNGVVYVHAGNTSPTLYALRATTGETLWRSNTATGYVGRAPIVTGGLVVVGSEQLALDPVGGLSAYRVGGCGAAVCPPVWDYAAGRAPWGDAAAANGVLYQGFADSHYSAIEVATGRLLWKAAIEGVPLPGPHVMGPATVAGDLLFAQAGGAVHAWAAGGCGAAVCQPLWRTPLGMATWARGDVVVVAGRVYVVDDFGTMHAYSARQDPPPPDNPPPVTPPAPPGPVRTTPTTIQVPRDHLSIQRAIDASIPGDTVLVAPGVYHERLDFHGHAVEVRSAGGPEVTVIDGDGLSTVVVFESEETRASVLRGFTIRNGVLSVSGGGINVTRASPTIAGNVITANQAIGGNGIYVYSGAPAIIGNQLRDNHELAGSSGSTGGAISLASSGGAEVRGNVIEDNSADNAGGLAASGVGPITVVDNVIRRNTSRDSSGGVSLGGGAGTLFMQNVVVDNATGNVGGGLNVSGSPSIVANTIAGNRAAEGSAVFVNVAAEGMKLAGNVLTGPAGVSVVECNRTYTDVVPAFEDNVIYSGDPSPAVGCGAGLGTADPRYVHPGAGDYRLGRGSPAIDAGRDTTPPRPATDVAGAPRVVDGNNDGVATVDLGAYEAQPPVPEALPGDEFHPLTPARILDTRSGARLGPAGTLDLQVSGRGGVPGAGVSAVVLNVTVTDPTATSYLTAWPAGVARPLASNLNYTAGQTVPNLVVVKVSDGGEVSLYNNLGSTHVVVDVAGWYASGSPGGARYSPVSPSRILDTRGGAPLGPSGSVDLQVTGQGGVPATGVSAVVLNVTVTQPTATSYLTAWPAGVARPLASNLNYGAGQTVPNLVVVKVGAGGRVGLYNNAGTTHVVADVAGWFGEGGIGSGFSSLTPARILDTRAGAPLAPAGTLDLQVTGLGGVPAAGVTAVVLNVTVTTPTAMSYLTMWPAGLGRPLASNLNYVGGLTVPNLVVVKVGEGGRVRLYNDAGWAHVVVDVSGWYG